MTGQGRGIVKTNNVEIFIGRQNTKNSKSIGKEIEGHLTGSAQTDKDFNLCYCGKKKISPLNSHCLRKNLNLRFRGKSLRFEKRLENHKFV